MDRKIVTEYYELKRQFDKLSVKDKEKLIKEYDDDCNVGRGEFCFWEWLRTQKKW